jgi:DNA processing protein
MRDSILATVLLNLVRQGVPGKDVSGAPLLHADAATLETFGFSRELATRLVSLRRCDAVGAEFARAERHGVRILVRGESDYPAELAAHPYAPSVLYLRGAWPPRPRVGIVGARLASSSMIAFAERLGEGAAAHGITVVSGLARGIDAAAHRGAQRAHGACAGVLGCGLDIVYPSDTGAVRRRVWDEGAMLATFPFGSAPLQHHFPLRNRLLAALCDAVVVVQASRESGSMSTARAALDAGIEVFAVPGSPDDPLAEGPNSLLRDGARPVLGPADVVESLLGIGAFQAGARDAEPAPVHDPFTAAILAEIGSVAADAATIAAALCLPTERVLARLIALELDGAVFRECGGLFRRRKAKPGRNSGIA